MNSAATTMPQFHPAKAFAYISFGCSALLLYTISSLTGGIAASVPAIGIPIAVFLLSQVFVRGARFNTDQVVSPKNWMLLLFSLQLLVIPLIVIITGFAQGELPHLPSHAAITAAVLLQSSAYVSCMTGFILVRRWKESRGNPPSTDSLIASVDQRAGAPRAVIAVTAVIGVVGLVLRFRSLADLTGYFTGTSPIAYDLTSAASVVATTAQSLSGLLLPYLGVAFALLGCRAIEQARRRSGRRARNAITEITVLGGLAAAYGLYSYSRGNVVMPILAMLATYSMRLRRVRALAVGVAAIAIVLAVVAVGSFRTAYFLNQAGVSVQLKSPSLTDTLQVYGQGPQFLGYLLDTTPANAVPMWGSTLASSALSPVPVLGKGFRATSTTVLYNDLIYGRNVATDQIVPLEGELFWNFDIPGVVVGFFGVGVAVGVLEASARRARRTFTCYVINYAGFWVAFMVVASVSILSQEFIYFMVPGLLALLGTGRLQRRPTAPLRQSLGEVR